MTVEFFFLCTLITFSSAKLAKKYCFWHTCTCILLHSSHMIPSQGEVEGGWIQCWVNLLQIAHLYLRHGLYLLPRMDHRQRWWNCSQRFNCLQYSTQASAPYSSVGITYVLLLFQTRLNSLLQELLALKSRLSRSLFTIASFEITLSRLVTWSTAFRVVPSTYIYGGV